MAFTNFRLMRKLLGPKWLVGENGNDSELIGYSLDLVRDAFAQRAFLALLARFPQNGPNGETAPPDALAALGRDRRVIRGFNESDQSYAIRLIAWLDDRRRAGNPFALMQKIAEYLGTSSGAAIKTVDVNGNWYVRAANGTETAYIKRLNWDWDGSGLAQWAKFWVIIHAPSTLWTEGANWGDTSGRDWGEESGTWGSTATYDQVQTIRAIIADWKNAGSTCMNVIIAFDANSFDPTAAPLSAGLPDGLWGHWGKTVNGVRVPARLSTARYCDGV